MSEFQIDKEKLSEKAMNQALNLYTGRNRVPYIFFGYHFLGGYKELQRMEETGELSRFRDHKAEENKLNKQMNDQKNKDCERGKIY